MEWTEAEQATLREGARECAAGLEVSLKFYRDSRVIGVSIRRGGEASAAISREITDAKDVGDAKDKIAAKIDELTAELTQNDPKPVAVKPGKKA